MKILKEELWDVQLQEVSTRVRKQVCWQVRVLVRRQVNWQVCRQVIRQVMEPLKVLVDNKLGELL